ncbi:MAG: hypothetical protein ACOX68_04365 [Candidatus Limivicinus sp.]|jgi:hypothetical protein
MEKKTRIIISAAFVISLLPMLLPQYGGCRGVQEISGLVNLSNPVGIISVILFFAGILFEKKHMGLIGCIGVAASEIFEFLTWHIMTISGQFSLETSFRLAYPEFYIGLAASAAMIVLYCFLVFRKEPDDREK